MIMHFPTIPWPRAAGGRSRCGNLGRVAIWKAPLRGTCPSAAEPSPTEPPGRESAGGKKHPNLSRLPVYPHWLRAEKSLLITFTKDQASMI